MRLPAVTPHVKRLARTLVHFRPPLIWNVCTLPSRTTNAVVVIVDCLLIIFREFVFTLPPMLFLGARPRIVQLLPFLVIPYQLIPFQFLWVCLPLFVQIVLFRMPYLFQLLTMFLLKILLKMLYEFLTFVDRRPLLGKGRRASAPRNRRGTSAGNWHGL